MAEKKKIAVVVIHPWSEGQEVGEIIKINEKALNGLRGHCRPATEKEAELGKAEPKTKAEASKALKDENKKLSQEVSTLKAKVADLEARLQNAG